MSAFFGLIGVLGVIVSIILLIILAIMKKRKKVWAIILGVSLCFFVVGLIIPSTPTSSNSVATSNYKLALLSNTSDRSYNFITVSGEVANISNEKLANVEVVVNFYGSDGIFIKSDSALIQYNPILSGQTSPFKAITTDNPAISNFKVNFSYLFGGTISTRDDRKE